MMRGCARHGVDRGQVDLSAALIGVFERSASAAPAAEQAAARQTLPAWLAQPSGGGFCGPGGKCLIHRP